VKAVHACNSTAGLLFANFPLFMLLSTTNLTPASLDVRAYPLLKMYVTFIPYFCQSALLFPSWLLFLCCIPSTVTVVLPWLLFCVPCACCHVHFLMPIPSFYLVYEIIVLFGMGFLTVWRTPCLEDQDVMLGFTHPGMCYVRSSAEACPAWNVVMEIQIKCCILVGELMPHNSGTKMSQVTTNCRLMC